MAAVDYATQQAKVKLLLLGGGQCGKSTFFKQIKVLHGKPFSVDELKRYTRIAYNNVHSMLSTLVEDGILGLGLSLSPTLKADIDAFRTLDVDAKIDEKKATLMKRIWNNPSAQEAWNRRVEFQIDDSAEYWFQNLDRLSQENYLATRDDVMRTRVRTTGIVEDEYIVNGVNFVIIDVGGQRNERSKWLHCFDDVTAIIFMCAMSGYNQVLFEDETTNRLMESLMLFQKLANSPFFEDTDIILFLNKFDLFKEKIKNVDIKNEKKGWFDGSQSFTSQTYSSPGQAAAWPPKYSGGCDEELGRQYIRGLFEDMMPRVNESSDEPKKLYAYETIATHKDNIQKAFDACKDIILERNIGESGF
jgi:GTPase SAR1 family protein